MVSMRKRNGVSDGFEIAPRQRFILQGLTTLVLVIITILINPYTNHELLAAEGVLQDQRSLPIDTVTVHKVSFSGNSVGTHSQFSEMAKAVAATPLSCHVCPCLLERTVIDLGVPSCAVESCVTPCRGNYAFPMLARLEPLRKGIGPLISVKCD